MMAVLTACNLTAIPAAMAARTPDGLEAFINKAAADIAASPIQVSQFKGATLDAVEDLGESNGARPISLLAQDRPQPRRLYRRSERWQVLSGLGVLCDRFITPVLRR